MKNSKWYALFGALFILLVWSMSVQAETINFDLGFVAPEQSMWGSGGTADFGVNGLIGNTTIGFAYDIGASSGTVEGSVNGVFNVDYAASMSGVGSTSITMSFAGNTDGGLVSSLFGAWVDFDAYIPIIGNVDLLCIPAKTAT